LKEFNYDSLIESAIKEDIGSGDITTYSLELSDRYGEGLIIAKEDLILAGIDIAERVFKILNPEIIFNKNYIDGDEVNKGRVIGSIKGKVEYLLAGERVALNFLQRLSGISTLTRRYVDMVKDYNVRILDTRKTTPGLRTLEKYAVKIGGGFNHRFGLFDGVLIKDNHIKAVGGIREAIKRARSTIPHTLKIEVEVKDLDEVEEALNGGADIIMLDNMSINDIERAVNIINKKIPIEVSGNIKLDNIIEVAKTGVNFISIGALTHSSKGVDISLEII
jgi:nicotinate-nucleotide pyrophosphorylase (carboxylating)